MPWIQPARANPNAARKIRCDLLCSWVTAKAYWGPNHARREPGVWWPSAEEHQGEGEHAWCPRCASAASDRANQSYYDKNINVKVGDFGLATRLSSSDEKRKTICGTPNYIAPEVIDGNKEKRGHSFEVDIWSMGVICFTTLVGKPPYESKDVKSTYQRILANQYEFPSHIPISGHARDLISAMLQTNPKKR